MRILLISSAFSGLTQRFYTELDDAGYQVSVELHTGDVDQLLEGVSLFNPDLILCPFLTRRLPRQIFENYRSLIVHPGIKGDRGPSSLDWAIQNGEQEWGVSLLEAREEMDAGAIWANRTFPLRTATKSSIFYREVTQAAVDCLWEVLTVFNTPDFKPEPLDYGRADVKGRLRPLMKQTDRAIQWNKHGTDEILRRINAADGSPGVLDEIGGKAVYLYNARKASGLSGKPGEIIAATDHAVCRATIDGAIWIGHLKPKLESGNGIKLPAAVVLKDFLSKSTFAKGSFAGLFSKSIQTISIDYTRAGRQLPCQEVWYEREGEVAYLYFPFHNGGMSTEQCRLLLSVYQQVATLPVKAIVLMGGEECWSNGIHLNHIEAAENPADESWLNINAIDDLIYQIMTTMDKLTVSAVAGSAGAGGAILALAADKVFARDGVIFNPHYKNMGNLYGSEYWTYSLPKRVGREMAEALTEDCLPISAKKAWRIGFIDRVLDKQQRIFTAQVKNLVNIYVADHEAFKKHLAEKAKTRCADETIKPLASYRRFELAKMHYNFYGSDAYHTARKQFVLKSGNDKETAINIAKHRHKSQLPFGSLWRFVWQDYYVLGNGKTDREHKDCLVLARKLASSASWGECVQNVQMLRRNVEEHFNAEETVMKQIDFRGAQDHAGEHRVMLDILESVQSSLQKHQWRPNDILEFIDLWNGHILQADKILNVDLKERALDQIPA